MKFVPLSLIICIGLCPWAMNLIFAFRQLSVSMFGNISICTARTVRHVNKQQHRTSLLQPIFTVKGPKYSTPTFAKLAMSSKFVLVSSLISGAIVCALPIRHVIRLSFIELKTFLKPIIHNRCWTKFLTSSDTALLFSLCLLRKKSSTKCCFESNKIGCFALKSNRSFFIMILALISPFSQKKVRTAKFYCLLEFSSQLWEISSHQQIVSTEIT